MDIAADLALFRAERDALAFLGLLSSLYLRFDPPISRGDGGTAQPTHFQGLNIHALIVENADGEVLALEHNQIQLTKVRSSMPNRGHCEWPSRE
jgi:hypothetical protein